MYADVVFSEQPAWSRRPGRRLALTLLPASVIVLGLLALLRLPIVEQSIPVTELVVRILSEAVEKVEETSVADAPQPRSGIGTAPVTSAPAVESPPAEPAAPVDWYALIPEAVRSALDNPPREYSINPGLDEKRRYAAEHFAPSRANAEPPTWENVERDVLGRTVLKVGDCYRVLDDPNVGSRDAFLVFGQFMVTCTKSREPSVMQPWANELRSRREARARYGRQAAE